MCHRLRARDYRIGIKDSGMKIALKMNNYIAFTAVFKNVVGSTFFFGLLGPISALPGGFLVAPLSQPHTQPPTR